MHRLQLVELEDLPWVPAAIRNGGTDLLDLMFAQLGFYRPLVDVFERALDASGGAEVVDLCSGGGGGALYMVRALQKRGRTGVRVRLTDLHPNEAARARAERSGLDYYPEPVDAMNVPAALTGLRTMFTALHHFPPEQVRALLAAAVAARTHLAFFDLAAQPVLRALPVPLAPLASAPNALVLSSLALALMPFVRPVRASNLLLTYLVPLVPLLFAWDGSVSALRAYTPEELLELARSVPGAEGYAWDAGRGGLALYLTGTPR